MVLVPATMALLGNANWWLPGWLDRLLPHLDLEGGTGTAGADEEPAEPEGDDDHEPVLEPVGAGAR
jgi:RND superfamily putative drug exporter